MSFSWLLSDVWFRVYVVSASELRSVSSLFDISRRFYKVEFLILEVF